MELPNLEEIEGEELSADQEDTQFHVDLEGAGNEEREGEESPVPLVLSEGDAPLSLGLRYSLKQVMSHEQANKLDVMMTISLQHFHSLCYCKGTTAVRSLNIGHFGTGHFVLYREAVRPLNKALRTLWNQPFRPL